MTQYDLLIFGITGNLAQIKVIPALYDLVEKGLLDECHSILCVGRKDWDKTALVEYIQTVLEMPNRHHPHALEKPILDKLFSKLDYVSGDFSDPQLYTKIVTASPCNKIVYLATYPDLYATIFEHMHSAGVSTKDSNSFRLLIEKPIGTDLKSAKLLNQLLAKFFDDSQVYRLDHYLGKETLQNILYFRFANGLFEHLFNNKFIDNIQITAAEDFGIDKRGGYYDAVGALRDVGQNHLLQMLTAVTMNAPTSFTNESVTHERVEVLKYLKPLPDETFFGQYQGYTQELNVDPKSTADTYFSLKCELDNPRFSGVPIFMRAGKKLAQTVTEISIVFKISDNRLFSHLTHGQVPNALIFRIQPNEGIILKLLAKKPGHQHELEPTFMQFCYKDLSSSIPDAYERLLADAIKGDQTFFNDPPEVELQWQFIDPLFALKQTPQMYEPGSWGVSDPFPWLIPSPLFCNF